MRGSAMGAVIAFVGSAMCQSRMPDATAFDVVSVKPSTVPNRRGSAGGPGSRDPGRYSFFGATLQDLIVVAYDVRVFQISSKAPLDSKRFDIEAKLPTETTAEQFHAMMRSMLAERFHLAAHIDSKEFAGFELAIADSGTKLRGATDGGQPTPPVSLSSRDDGFPNLAPNKPGMVSRQTTNGRCTVIQVRAQEQTMAHLADWLQSLDEGPIRDATGLPGKYDFTIEYGRELLNAGADQSPDCQASDLFAALKQQLGLQLVRRKLHIDVVVIESVDGVPTQN
jgi:uncharacterized protein (TIGR03435 family)